jgi:para-aminobenzoate synthetase/4-amino-4-deoxychorismate lyase
LLEEHLKRLKESAAYFDYPLDEEELTNMLARLRTDVQAFSDDVRVRMVLHRDGRPSFAFLPLAASSNEPLRVRLAAAPVHSCNRYLYHKTTYRKPYEDALASVPECDDVILWNERGEITEATVANVVVELDGTLYTPPISSGLLAGTFREVLLKEGHITERVITREDLQKATRLFLINSVRKWRRAILL